MMLTPADVYALQMLVACGRLYRFGNAYRLDVADSTGDIRLVSLRRVRWLHLQTMADQLGKPFVPGATDTANVTTFGRAIVDRFGWPTVWREWNEVPQVARA